MISSAITGIINYIKEQSPITPEKSLSIAPGVLGLSIAGAVGIESFLTATGIKIAEQV